MRAVFLSESEGGYKAVNSFFPIETPTATDGINDDVNGFPPNVEVTSRARGASFGDPAGGSACLPMSGERRMCRRSIALVFVVLAAVTLCALSFFTVQGGRRRDGVATDGGSHNVRGRACTRQEDIGCLDADLAMGSYFENVRKATARELVVEAEVPLSQKPVFVKWSAHPNMCLNVLGGYVKNGNAVQIESCRPSSDMEFLVPSQGVGLIRWSEHPELCLDAPDGSKVIIWPCDTGVREHMLFAIPPGRNGFIRLASRMDRCLKVPNGAKNGDWLQMSWCNSADSDYLNFMTGDTIELPTGAAFVAGGDALAGAQISKSTRKGSISWQRSDGTHKCFDKTGDAYTNGNAVQIWSCDDRDEMLFLMPPSGTGLIKWNSHPDVCVDSPDGTKVIMWKCAEGNKRHMYFTMPDGDSGLVRLAAQPDMCLSVPDARSGNGVWMMIKPCLEASVLQMHSNDCAWGGWSDYSSCSRDCEAGVRTRSREVKGGAWQWAHGTLERKDCSTGAKEVSYCNIDPCSTTTTTTLSSTRTLPTLPMPSTLTTRTNTTQTTTSNTPRTSTIAMTARFSTKTTTRTTTSATATSTATRRDTTSTSSPLAVVVSFGNVSADLLPASPSIAPKDATDSRKSNKAEEHMDDIRKSTRAEVDVAAPSSTSMGVNRSNVVSFSRSEPSVWTVWRVHPRSFGIVFVTTFTVFFPVCCWLIPKVMKRAYGRGWAEYVPAKVWSPTKAGPPAKTQDADGCSRAGFANGSPRRFDGAGYGSSVQVRFPDPEDSD